MTAVGIGAMLQGASYPMGTLGRMGPGFFPAALGTMLALVGVAIAIAGRFTAAESDEHVAGPEWRGWACIAGSIVAFVVLGTYGGLLPATFAIVFISALGDRDNTLVGAVVLAGLMVAVCVIVFWWALQLQFPLFAWG
jgi:hypothetical protein